MNIFEIYLEKIKSIISELKKHNKIIARNTNVIFKLCYLALKTKIKFFLGDIYEKNKRLSLNFGHTFAHAIEMAIELKTKKDFIRHGEAVGIGMLCEVYYEKKKRDKIFKVIEELLKKYNLPTKLLLAEVPLSKEKLHNSIFKNIFLDKKRVGKNPRYISIKKLHQPQIKEIKDLNFLNETILETIYS